MLQAFAIELPWWTVPFLFGLPAVFFLVTALLVFATYRLLRRPSRDPAKVIMLTALWVIFGMAWLYLRRVF